MRVHNALLRCVRADDRAVPLFERITEVPGLWVLELGPFMNDPDDSWASWLSDVHQTLELNSALLRDLSEGSSDYTFHVTLEFAESHQSLMIPPAISGILSSCGITLELFSATATGAQR